jgi:RHS repeat-associated protein
MLSKNGVSYSYQTGGSTKPHAVTQIGATAYTYDANGNMNVGTARAWDAENRLTSITKDGVTTTFGYDGDGARIKQTANGATTIYVNQFYQKTGDNVTTNYYLGSQLIAVRSADNLSYIHQDSLGSTSVTSNSSGNITSTVKYFSFGLTRSSSGTMPTDREFTGQILDTTGLYFYNARYYDPAIGRFISADSIIPHFGDSQSLNRYSYCLNNPLKYTDPTGHDGDVDGDGFDDETGEYTGVLDWDKKKECDSQLICEDHSDIPQILRFVQPGPEIRPCSGVIVSKLMFYDDYLFTLFGTNDVKQIIISNSTLSYLLAQGYNYQQIADILGPHIAEGGTLDKYDINFLAPEKNILVISAAGFSLFPMKGEEGKPKSPRFLDTSYLKSLGISPHAVKELQNFTGKGNSKWNLYRDKSDGSIWQLSRNGVWQKIPYSIDDLKGW